eukprot:TRINITY_DN6063_c0_g2_i4.p1 TRINITY_DN6063_c0_g2~~TRINITY_DN6063_c0_g2_i4.p1  ORF type:complete len:310 (-),score=-21.81 TRINITY_DN6063_c0_g2_i4:28-822(-)
MYSYHIKFIIFQQQNDKNLKIGFQSIFQLKQIQQMPLILYTYFFIHIYICTYYILRSFIKQYLFYFFSLNIYKQIMNKANTLNISQLCYIRDLKYRVNSTQNNQIPRYGKKGSAQHNFIFFGLYCVCVLRFSSFQIVLLKGDLQSSNNVFSLIYIYAFMLRFVFVLVVTKCDMKFVRKGVLKVEVNVFQSMFVYVTVLGEYQRLKLCNFAQKFNNICLFSSFSSYLAQMFVCLSIWVLYENVLDLILKRWQIQDFGVTCGNKSS